MSVEEKVKNIIVEQLGVDMESVTPEASFIDDLGADSLDIVELVMTMEEEFDLEIPDGNISCGRDVFIDVDVVLEGEVELGDRVRIGPFNHIRDATIGADSEVYAHSWIESASIGARCKVGPFARLRPAAVLDDDARVGNFVEVKKSVIGPGSKVNHLSYVGDSTLGKGVNVGQRSRPCSLRRASTSSLASSTPARALFDRSLGTAVTSRS